MARDLSQLRQRVDHRELAHRQDPGSPPPRPLEPDHPPCQGPIHVNWGKLGFGAYTVLEGVGLGDAGAAVGYWGATIAVPAALATPAGWLAIPFLGVGILGPAAAGVGLGGLHSLDGFHMMHDAFSCG